MTLVRILSACICLSFATAQGAKAQDWIVEQVLQPAQFTLASDPEGVPEDDGLAPSAPDEGEVLLVAAQPADVEWNDLAPGMTVPNGSWIRTGETGRLQLRRGEEIIQFKPGTTASIVTWTQDNARLTDIEQRSGSILFDVETRDTKHTLVETGLLAALVKGTRFLVHYDGETAALRVEHGIVEAVDLVRMERVDVRERQSVEVSRGNPEPMTVRGPGPKDEVSAIGSEDSATPEKIRFVPGDAPDGGLAEALASQESAMAFRRAALIEERRAARIAARQDERRAIRVEERRATRIEGRRAARVDERKATRIEERREERVLERQEERRSTRVAERVAARQEERREERVAERQEERRDERWEDRVAERQAERVAARQEERKADRAAERRAARQSERAAAEAGSSAPDSQQKAQTGYSGGTSKDVVPGSSGDTEESASAPSIEPQPSSGHETSDGTEHPNSDPSDATDSAVDGAFEGDDAADKEGKPTAGAGSLQPGTVDAQPEPSSGEASAGDTETDETGDEESGPPTPPAQPGAEPVSAPPPAGDEVRPETVHEVSDKGAGAPTSGSAGDGGDDGNGADTDDHPESSDGLSPEERRAQRVAERQAERQAERRAEREAERQAEQAAEDYVGATPPQEVAGKYPDGIGEASAAHTEIQGPVTGENSPPGDRDAASSEGGTPVANAPDPGIVDPSEQNGSGVVAAGASSHTLAQEASPGQDTRSSPPDGDAAPSTSPAEMSDLSHDDNGASKPSTVRDDANETAEERRERRAAERQAERQAERAAERQAERQTERQPEGRAPQDGEAQPPDIAEDRAGNFDETFAIVARGLSGSTLQLLLADLDLLSVDLPWPDDATFTIAARRSSGSDAGATPLAQQDVAHSLFRLLEETGVQAMTFEVDVPYDLIIDAEGASILDPMHDQPRIQVRAIFAPAAAPDIAPVPLPAPGLLLFAAVIGLGALRSVVQPEQGD